jgi:hypothetical protein
MAEREIDDARIAAFCGLLVEYGVEFIVIGGVAARLHDTLTLLERDHRAPAAPAQ